MPLFCGSSSNEFDGILKFNLLDMSQQPTAPQNVQKNKILETSESEFAIKFENFFFDISISTSDNTPIKDDL